MVRGVRAFRIILVDILFFRLFRHLFSQYTGATDILLDRKIGRTNGFIPGHSVLSENYVNLYVIIYKQKFRDKLIRRSN